MLRFQSQIILICPPPVFWGSTTLEVQHGFNIFTSCIYMNVWQGRLLDVNGRGKEIHHLDTDLLEALASVEVQEELYLAPETSKRFHV